MAEQPKIDRLGVSALDGFFSRHGWLFREQTVHDFGIDAQVEIVRDGKATGSLIGLQIKSGKSFFAEETEDAFVYRTDETHMEYWSKHSLPVIVVIYHPKSQVCYWQRATSETVASTGKGWKIEIPKANLLTDQSLGALDALVQPAPYIQRLNKLRLDKKWITLIAEGETVYIEYEDWINKSLPRFGITLGCASRDDIDEEVWPLRYGTAIEALLASTLPWADFEMDWDAYAEFMESIWADECYRGHDEDGEVYFSEPFESWYRRPDEEITHVSDNGETQGYRLLLSLNEIGTAFVALEEYLAEGDSVTQPGFSIDD